MNTRIKTYIVILILIVLGIVYFEYQKPKKINWFPSYSANHKIPYGTYILNKELSSIFKKGVINIYKPPYTFLKEEKRLGTYFFVDGTLNFSKNEFSKLLEFVARGNDVFISTNGANIDTLNLKSKSLYTTSIKEKHEIRLVNRKLQSNNCKFDRDFSKVVISKLDTLNTTILGELFIKNGNDSIIAKGANFIKIRNGKGNLYLHTFPEAFINYTILLGDNHQYISSVLSYLDSEKPIFWDAYYKTGKSRITSPMHYILTNRSLKWAYYLFLIGVLFFVIFKGKRNQRIIPVITPLKNQTLAFTRTIAGMYYENSDHKTIATHKITCFLEYIRNKYRLSTLNIDEEFYKRLSSRSAVSIDEVETLFQYIEVISKKNSITKEELTDLNTKIEQFKKIE